VVTSGALIIAAACTVRPRVAECERLPDVPVNVTDEVAATVFNAAISVVLCATPGVRLSVAGFAVTPAGSPPIATATVPLNELTAAAVTLTAALAPLATIVTDAGDRVSV
jgi:hypothetical protein